MLGALMTLGIGMYGPCMILISLLGMNPKAAFPIMMGSCAFLMPVGSARFIREKRYNLKSALGLTIGGIPGVLIAAYIVREMSLGHRALAGDHGGGLHRRDDAPVGCRRTPPRRNRCCRIKSVKIIFDLSALSPVGTPTGTRLRWDALERPGCTPRPVISRPWNPYPERKGGGDDHYSDHRRGCDVTHSHDYRSCKTAVVVSSREADVVSRILT